MPNESNRNLVIFMVVALAILGIYQFAIILPKQKADAAKAKAVAAQKAEAQAAGQAMTPTGPPIPVTVPRAQALAASPRIAIETPALKGTIALKGARFDDLFLIDPRYRETVDPKSPPVNLLRPLGTTNAWFADIGWSGQNLPGAPTSDTLWTVADGAALTPSHPVVLTYTTPQNLVFTRKISVDDKYMFTVEDTVANRGGASVTLQPYASVWRNGLPAGIGANGIVHEGAIGVLGAKGTELHELKYKDWMKKASQTFTSTGGWLGITDKYWLVAVAPQQKGVPEAAKQVTGVFTAKKDASDIYQSAFSAPNRSVAPGAQTRQVTYLFAGAKEAGLLKGYEKTLELPNFDQAVDWGRWFWFLTRPVFMLLDFLYKWIGNFGIAMLALTVITRLVLFPLANKSYESMSRMKKLQPQLEELKVRFKDDPAKQQQEMMQMYQREKINPLMGCLPILIQIPIFYAVYKTLSVTIEMRHAPFFGWVHDLSSKDPTTIFNLFGLIPWNPSTAPMIGGLMDSYLHLGVLPLLYGFTMWLTTAMNPPAPDPMQQRIFQLMPIMFTFIMAPFAAGLLIYWTWSNILSILQQYVIMHRLEVDNPIDDFINRFRGKEKSVVT